MKKRNEQFYESPQMKVFETKMQRVLCASGPTGGTETSQEGNPYEWYN